MEDEKWRCCAWVAEVLAGEGDACVHPGVHITLEQARVSESLV